MKLIERRREATRAFDALRRRENEWSARTRVLRAYASRHRAGLLVGSGFAAGVATALLPLAKIARLVSAFAGTTAMLASGPLARVLVAPHVEASQQAPKSAE